MKTLAKLFMTVSVIFLVINLSEANTLFTSNDNINQLVFIDQTLSTNQKKDPKKRRVVRNHRKNTIFLVPNQDFDLKTSKIDRLQKIKKPSIKEQKGTDINTGIPATVHLYSKATPKPNQKRAVRNHRKKRPVMRKQRKRDRVVRDHRKKYSVISPPSKSKKNREVRSRRRETTRNTSTFGHISDGSSNTFKSSKKVSKR